MENNTSDAVVDGISNAAPKRRRKAASVEGEQATPRPRRKKVAPVEPPTSTAVEQVEKTTSKSGTVMVGLNRAQGITFRLPGGRNVTVAGNAVHLRGKEMGVLPPAGSFGLTTINKSDWEEIEKIYGNTALFRSGRIFAATGKTDALHEAKEREETRNGLEAASGVRTKPAEGGV